MGDNINIDWQNAGQVPDFGNAMLTGWNAGRQMGIDRTGDEARAAAQANPNSIDAIQHLAIYDPVAAKSYTDRLDLQRAQQFRQSAGSYIGQMFPNNGNAFGASSVAPSAPTSPAPTAPPNGFAPPQPSAPIAPGGQPGFADAMGGALQGTPGAPPPPAQPQGMTQQAPQSPSQPQQAASWPNIDASHPMNVAAGQAAISGNPINYLANMYANDPAGADKMVTAVSSLDKIRLERLSESTGAIASEAYKLMTTIPEADQQGRAAALQQLAPYLTQHGVLPQQIQAAIQGGLTDRNLQGIIGQATTVQQAIEETHKNASDSIADRNATNSENTQTETVRHNMADENQGVVVQNPLGGSSLVRRSDGSIMYNSDAGGAAPTDLAGIAGQIAKVEGTAKNPASSATGVGQFTNATWLTAYKSQFGGQNMSDAQILAMRDNPQIASQVLQAATQNNMTMLQKAGLPATAGNTYLMHFLGGGAAPRVISANPATPIAQLVSPAAIAANPFLSGKTAGDIQQWAAGKMGGGGGSDGMTANALKTTAQQIATYNMPPPTGRVLASPRGAVLMQMIHDANPNYDATRYPERADAVKQFGAGKLGNQVRSLNVGVDHLQTLQGAAEALQNGNIPLFNGIAQSFAQATGQAAPTNFNTIKDLVADEVVKGIIGTPGGVGDRAANSKKASDASSPAQLAGTMSSWKNLLAGQLHGLQTQYENSTGLKDFNDKLHPNTIAALGAATSSSNPQITPTNVSTYTPQQVASLAPGTMFRTTDGRMMRKR